MNKFESSPIAKEFQKQFKSCFGKKKPAFICGVSGGVDSMSLLYLLHRFDIAATVVHCNYRLRGEESDKDQEFIEQICSLWNMECISAVFDPEKRNRKNIQAWARELRYRVFRDVKKELNADFIITAHHQDDQIETVFQKILRGAGITSWKGMQVKEGDIFRPLLEISKEGIREFADRFEVPSREDESNLSANYARNFIRLEWVEKLDELFPGWKQNILKIPDRALETELLAEELLKHIMIDEQSISRERFLALNRKVQPLIIAEFVKKSEGEQSVSAGFLSEVNSLETLQTGGSITLPGGRQLVRDRDKFTLLESSAAVRSVWVIEKEDLENKPQIAGFTISELKWDGTVPEESLILDRDKIIWPLTVRNWKQGDTIRPFGLEGTQLVSDLLTNKKIDTVQKNSAKVIQSFDGNISAVIFPHITKNGQFGVISELFKCTDSTSTILKISRQA